MSHLANRNGRRPILVTVLMVCIALASSGAIAAEGITGEWDMKTQFDEFESLATVVISEAADGTLAGTWGSSQLSDVKFADGKLTFTRTMGMGDRQFTMDFSGTLADGKLTGAMSSEWGDITATGMRPKAKSPVLGQWDIAIDMGGQVINAVLTVSENEEGSLEGTWTSEYGTHVVSNVRFADGKLTLDRKSDMPDFGEMESSYSGTVEGNALQGTIVSDFGDIPANGKRAGTGLIGTWQLTTTSDFGEMPGMMKIYSDLTGRYESFGGEIPFNNLKLEGNQITFSIEMGFRGETFTSNFKGTVDGNTLKGQMDTQMGVNDVVGKKMVEAKPDAAAAGSFVGTWEFTSESPRGTMTNTLKINDDMTGTYAFRNNETPISDLAVDGDQISFKVTMSFGDRDFTLEFKGALADGELKGEFISERGARPATGKKVQ